MIKIKNILGLLLLIFVTSCSSDDDNLEDNPIDQTSIPVLSTVTIDETNVTAGSTVVFTVTTTESTFSIESIALVISSSEEQQEQFIGGNITNWTSLGNDQYSILS